MLPRMPPKRIRETSAPGPASRTPGLSFCPRPLAQRLCPRPRTKALSKASHKAFVQGLVQSLWPKPCTKPLAKALHKAFGQGLAQSLWPRSYFGSRISTPKPRFWTFLVQTYKCDAQLVQTCKLDSELVRLYKSKNRRGTSWTANLYVCTSWAADLYKRTSLHTFGQTWTCKWPRDLAAGLGAAWAAPPQGPRPSSCPRALGGFVDLPRAPQRDRLGSSATLQTPQGPRTRTWPDLQVDKLGLVNFTSRQTWTCKFYKSTNLDL